jgi:hypothetical protein
LPARRSLSPLLALALLAALLTALTASPASADSLTFACGTAGTQTAQGATFANQASPGATGGTAVLVENRMGSGQERRSYFECVVANIPAGATVTSATLNLRAKSGSNTTATVRVHQVTTDFAEGTLTWNNKPAHSATVLSSKTGFAFDELWNAPVGTTVTGNGTFRYATTRPAGQTVPQTQNFASDEHATVAHRPTLTVNFTPATPATVTVGSVTCVGHVGQGYNVTYTVQNGSLARSGAVTVAGQTVEAGLSLAAGASFGETATVTGTHASLTATWNATPGGPFASPPFATPTCPDPPTGINDGLWRNRNLNIGTGDEAGSEDHGVGWRARMDREVAQFGAFQGTWHDYNGVGETDVMSAAAEQALAQGRRLTLGWKPWDVSWQDTASGGYDTELNQVFTDAADNCGGTAATPVRDAACSFVIGHEADNDPPFLSGNPAFQAADYRAMWQRVMNARDSHCPECKLGWVVTGFGSGPGEPDPGNKKQDYLDLWPDNDARRPDFKGHDPYIQATVAAAEIATRIEGRTAWLTANLDGPDQVMIFEWGCDHGGTLADRGTVQHRAACFDAVRANLADMAALGIFELTLYDARSNELANYGSELNTPADENAYQALLDALRA